MRDLLTMLGVAAIIVSGGCGRSAGPTGPSALMSNVPVGVTASPPASGPADATGAKTQEISLDGDLEGTFTVAPTADPLVVNIHLDAAGTAPHIGSFRFVSDHAVDFRSLEGAGTGALVAAASGTLTGTLTGKAMPGTSPGAFDIEETFEIHGGTGRFAGASGTIIITRSTTPPAPEAVTTSGSFHGTITVPRGQ